MKIFERSARNLSQMAFKIQHARVRTMSRVAGLQAETFHKSFGPGNVPKDIQSQHIMKFTELPRTRHFLCELPLPLPEKCELSTDMKIKKIKTNRSEVVRDIETLPNFFWSFALFNVLGYSFAGQVEKVLHVQEIGGLNKQCVNIYPGKFREEDCLPKSS